MNITRLLARQLRSVLRQAGIGKKFGGFGPRIFLQAQADSLTIRAASNDAAVEYRLAGSFEPMQAWLPLKVLDDCEGPKADPVTIESCAPSLFRATWTDRGIPQLMEYPGEYPENLDRFPAVPENLAVQEPDLLQALRDATGTVTHDNTRYALNCLQLDGAQGRICGTDGRQVLLQTGFSFPWTDALLLPGSRVFGCKEFPKGDPVSIGQAGNWIALAIGPWTLWFSVQTEARFPKLHDLFRAPDAASSRLHLSAGDAQFLVDAVSRLPIGDQHDHPITLDLNGQVIIRSHTPESHTRELILSNSRLNGEPLTLNTNRDFLVRAAKLGFQDFALFGNEKPAQCHDARRTYLWALLTPEDAFKASDDAIRIQSPPEGTSSTVTAIPTTQVHPTKTMPKPKPTHEQGSQPVTSQFEAASATRQVPAASESTSHTSNPIDQAIALRESLRETLAKTTDLIHALKQQKRQSKLVATTLASLKQLQAA